MNTKLVINRLSTGVPGLDEVLGGGLPEYSFNLIGGSPGCGKTTLAHQIMFSIATPERRALYLTVLGEPPIKMLRYQQQFDFFDSARLDDAIRFVDLSDDAIDGDLEVVLKRIVEVVKEHDPAFVFIDSFRSIARTSTPEAGGAGALQRFVQQLGVVMGSWQATTFLIGEYYRELEVNPVFTVADGLIWLRQSVERDSMVRKLEVMKMRGSSTVPGLHTFRISNAGINVFAPARVTMPHDAASDLQPSTMRLAMGTPGLDEMMGGGLPAGYSVLVAGPSGSGKSILAAAFLAEGARDGQNGVIVAFEQSPFRSRNQLVAELIRSGRVGLIDTGASDLSIDEIARQLVGEIERLGAKRVVIDSLSGFELALAPTFRDDFRESLARFVTALASTGVTLLMTSELEDRYTDLRFSPYGTAFLTDAIIVQRYIEVDSRLRRVLAVVKVRASSHSDELREFHIDAEGIRIGERLDDQEGLLGGRPTRKAPAVQPIPPPPAD